MVELITLDGDQARNVTWRARTPAPPSPISNSWKIHRSATLLK